MSILKGEISIKTPSIDNHGSPNHVYCKTAEFVNSNDVGALSKDIFYACASCNGPLIPIATCTYCKKASLRKCVKCDKPKIQSHDSCTVLISFGNKIAQKFTKEVHI